MNNKEIKNNILKYFLIYLIFQNVILFFCNEKLRGIINFTDEIICIILVVLSLISNNFKIKMLPFEKKCILLLLLMEIIGILCGFHNDYQEKKWVLVDAFTCCKFFLYYFSVRTLIDEDEDDRYLLGINNFFKMISVFVFILAIHDIFFSPLFEKYDFRYFTYSLQLCFGHPDSLAKFCITIIYILTFNLKYQKNNIVYIILLSFVVVFTFRTKAIVGLFMYFLIYIYFGVIKIKSKVPFIILGIVGVLYLGYDTFLSYYSHADYTRTLLTVDSINIAKNMFPFGSGFGSFASNVAAVHYSKLYEKLGYLKIWGMGRDSEFLSDTFWPIIIAETGVIGLICFISMIYQFIKYIFNEMKGKNNFFIVALSIFCYQLISSLGAPAFFHPESISQFFLLGILIKIFNNGKENKNEFKK